MAARRIIERANEREAPFDALLSGSASVAGGVCRRLCGSRRDGAALAFAWQGAFRCAFPRGCADGFCRPSALLGDLKLHDDGHSAREMLEGFTLVPRALRTEFGGQALSLEERVLLTRRQIGALLASRTECLPLLVPLALAGARRRAAEGSPVIARVSPQAGPVPRTVFARAMTALEGLLVPLGESVCGFFDRDALRARKWASSRGPWAR